MSTPTETTRAPEPVAAPRRPRGGPRAWIAGGLTSVRLTLWLLGILIVTIAVATILPQGGPQEMYEQLFATSRLGPALGMRLGRALYWLGFSHAYGVWWFIATFGLLGVNLLACSLQRTRQLLRLGTAAAGPVTRAQVRARGHQLRWQLPGTREQAVEALRLALARRGWRAAAVAGEDGEVGLVAARGRLAPWAPTLVHVGMAIMLLGAAWGRFPGLTVGSWRWEANTYRAMLPIVPGSAATATPPDARFDLLLRKAGSAQSATGQPTDYWAEVDVLEGGKVVKSALVKPNHPLVHRHVCVTLNSIVPRWAVEVSRGGATGQVPIVFTEDGQVDMVRTVTRLDDPPWVVFLHQFGEGAQGRLQAQVFVDESGELSQNWRAVGWVSGEGTDYHGARFRLVSLPPAAVLALDRDVGIPIVYAGFAAVVLGTLLVLGTTRHTLTALVSQKGSEARVLIGVSRSRTGPSGAKLLEPVRADLHATPGAETYEEENG